MTLPTRSLFLEDSYMKTCEAHVVSISDMDNNISGIVLDQTNFYATSGGQPGDCGNIQLADGSTMDIINTIKDKETGCPVLVPAAGMKVPQIGDVITCHVDWDRRYRLMQMHTACHLLSVVCPYPITSANVGETESRIDFDMPEVPGTKQEISNAMMQLVAANHVIYEQWVEEAELDANPELVKSKNVRPPRGIGRIRLVCIGENSSIDSQPCGGTHIKTTGEVGDIHIGKIENKGKENRRFRIRFGEFINV